MDEHEKIIPILNLIKEDRYLHSLVGAATPQAILMPFAHERGRLYVTIGLFFFEEHLTRDTLISVCKYVVTILKKNNLLSGLDGLEIMPCLVKNEKTERVFRLSILSHALDRVEGLAVEDIDRQEPFEGITCILYKKNF